jgi:hypothetical protein
MLSVPCHRDMARPQLADGDGLQIWRISCEYIEKSGGQPTSGDPPASGLDGAANNSLP